MNSTLTFSTRETKRHLPAVSGVSNVSWDFVVWIKVPKSVILEVHSVVVGEHVFTAAIKQVKSLSGQFGAGFWVGEGMAVVDIIGAGAVACC